MMMIIVIIVIMTTKILYRILGIKSSFNKIFL